MKFFMCVTLLALQFASLVSSQSITEIVFELITLNEKERSASGEKISLQYDETKLEINNQLNTKVIPAINEVYEDIENYIQSLESKISASGYNPTDCVTAIENILKSGTLPNITQKAKNEVPDVYEKMANNIQSSGLYNLEIISREVESIASDYVFCMDSIAPEYCNSTLSNNVLAKQEEMPVLYEKEVQRTKLYLLQQVVDYESRINDYVQEAIAATKPYLVLLESCVSAVISVAK